MGLNEKQQKVFDKALSLFGTDRVNAKKDLIEQIIKKTGEIEYVDYSDSMVRDLLNDFIYDKKQENLFTKYIQPPFSVLDTKSGEWSKRKQLLDDYFGNSLIGRQDGLAYGDLKVREDDNGTSQFDSLLCEIILKWFGFPGCNVYDAFAGGHIRGNMSTLLGYHYTGIELCKEQVDANNLRAKELNLLTKWINDDSLNVDNYLGDNTQDLFFTCPPYGDLEQYTDDERDLSNMSYENFIKTYNKIIKKGCAKLKDDRFAVFVVGDFRDNDGFYRGFIKDTIIAFEQAGLKLYNELILLNNIGTASLRAGNGMRNRKVVKTHQNILVFYKGNPDNIKLNYNQIDSSLPFKTAKQGGLF